MIESQFGSMWRAVWPVVAVLGTLVFWVALFCLAVYAVASAGVPYAVPVVAYLFVLGGWLRFAQVRYRYGRQDEFLQLLTAAVESEMPLAPAVRAFAQEHQSKLAVQLPLALLLTLLFPGFVLGWAVFWAKRYDRRVAQTADLLEDGVSLSDALREVPGIASPEMQLAVRVGEETGHLAACLRSVQRERSAAAWLELVPQFLYPFGVLWFVFGIVSFLMIVILPKFKRIFQEFNLPLPELTQRLVDAWDVYASIQPLVAMLFLGGLVLVATALVHPRVRWWVPLVGRLYRWEVQGHVLRLLGTLVAAGKTAPDALELLADADEFPGVVQTRLQRALDAVVAGQPLATALGDAGLLPAAMVPLLTVSERTRTLSWALGELGTVQSTRAIRLGRRIAAIASPIFLLAVGGIVAFVAIATFVPLIALLAELSP